MRHVTLTCINHPELRWSCKEIAVNANGSYNGTRNIFYIGKHISGNTYDECILECPCPASALRFAPEELERQKTEPLEG